MFKVTIIKMPKYAKNKFFKKRTSYTLKEVEEKYQELSQTNEVFEDKSPTLTVKVIDTNNEHGISDVEFELPILPHSAFSEQLSLDIQNTLNSMPEKEVQSIKPFCDDLMKEFFNDPEQKEEAPIQNVETMEITEQPQIDSSVDIESEYKEDVDNQSENAEYDNHYEEEIEEQEKPEELEETRVHKFHEEPVPKLIDPKIYITQNQDMINEKIDNITEPISSMIEQGNSYILNHIHFSNMDNDFIKKEKEQYIINNYHTDEARQLLEQIQLEAKQIEIQYTEALKKSYDMIDESAKEQMIQQHQQSEKEKLVSEQKEMLNQYLVKITKEDKEELSRMEKRHQEEKEALEKRQENEKENLLNQQEKKKAEVIQSEKQISDDNIENKLQTLIDTINKDWIEKNNQQLEEKSDNLTQQLITKLDILSQKVNQGLTTIVSKWNDQLSEHQEDFNNKYKQHLEEEKQKKEELDKAEALKIKQKELEIEAERNRIEAQKSQQLSKENEELRDTVQTLKASIDTFAENQQKDQLETTTYQNALIEKMQNIAKLEQIRAETQATIDNTSNKQPSYQDDKKHQRNLIIGVVSALFIGISGMSMYHQYTDVKADQEQAQIALKQQQEEASKKQKEQEQQQKELNDRLDKLAKENKELSDKNSKQAEDLKKAKEKSKESKKNNEDKK